MFPSLPTGSLAGLRMFFQSPSVCPLLSSTLFCIHSAVINKLLFSVFACLFVLYPTTVVAFIALLCLDPLIHSKCEMSETVCGAVLHDLMCLHACSPQRSVILISKRC